MMEEFCRSTFGASSPPRITDRRHPVTQIPLDSPQVPQDLLQKPRPPVAKQLSPWRNQIRRSSKVQRRPRLNQLPNKQIRSRLMMKQTFRPHATLPSCHRIPPATTLLTTPSTSLTTPVTSQTSQTRTSGRRLVAAVEEAVYTGRHLLRQSRFLQQRLRTRLHATR